MCRCCALFVLHAWHTHTNCQTWITVASRQVGATPLHYAALSGDLYVFEAVVETETSTIYRHWPWSPWHALQHPQRCVTVQTAWGTNSCWGWCINQRLDAKNCSCHPAMYWLEPVRLHNMLDAPVCPPACDDRTIYHLIYRRTQTCSFFLMMLHYVVLLEWLRDYSKKGITNVTDLVCDTQSIWGTPICCFPQFRGEMNGSHWL